MTGDDRDMFKLSRTTTAVVAAAAAIAAGCGDDEEPEPAASPPPAETSTMPPVEEPTPDAQKGDRLGELLAQPADFDGQEVTITGEVSGATSAPAAFQIIEPRGRKPGIVVLPTESVTDVRSVVTGKTATVSGKVMKVTPGLADEGAFLFETDDNASNTLERIDTEYVVAADSVALIE